MKTKQELPPSINNIYTLDGRVPLGKAIPFGLQTEQTAMLIQNAMFVAGIATLFQLYPVWKIGAKLPIVMGVSFTFVTILSSVGAQYGYSGIMGAVLEG